MYIYIGCFKITVVALFCHQELPETITILQLCFLLCYLKLSPFCPNCCLLDGCILQISVSCKNPHFLHLFQAWHARLFSSPHLSVPLVLRMAWLLFELAPAFQHKSIKIYHLLARLKGEIRRIPWMLLAV